MTTYVCGFLHVGDEVLLIQKKRPDWQAGLLNGVGGHVEEGESVQQAMVREFREETGVDRPWWWSNFFAIIRGNPHIPSQDWCCYFYSAKADHRQYRFTNDDEKLRLVHIHNIHRHPVMPNLSWLIPMGLHIHRERELRRNVVVEVFDVTEVSKERTL